MLWLIVLPIQAYAYTNQQIASAIAWQETHLFQAGIGVTKNNPCGIRRAGRDMEYSTKIEGMSDCIDVWGRIYAKSCPSIQDARRWTGYDGEQWLQNVLWYLQKKYDLQ